ncbi:MAG TPA: TIM barrel protein [Thermomicrobiales bacterium]|nr:TIM barrel protein [Thermomicrobiales bacterium]
MPTSNPILISVVQYDADLKSGAMSLTGVAQRAQQLGADGVEYRDGYWREKDAELPALRQALRDLNLTATYATMATLFNTDQAGAAQLSQDIADAAALGSPLLRVFLGELPQGESDPAWAGARRAVEEAASQGIVLALENFARAPGCRVAEIARALAAIDTPTLQTNVDIGNYALNDEDIPAAIRQFGRRVVSSHLKDNAGTDATYLGGGSLPLPAILDAFDRLPQQVMHCFEFGGGDDPDGRIAASLAYLRQR